MFRKLLQTARHWPSVWLAQKIEQSAEGRIRCNEVLWCLLEPYIQRSPSTGVSFSDYGVLYQWIKKYRPREVLECGTGMSTVVIAQALRENFEESGVKGRVTSMEEYENYHASAKSLFPRELDEYAEILFSPAVEDHYHLFRGTRYAEIPDRKYDFVFVDGPALLSDPKDPNAAINMDFIKLVAKADHPIAALIDTRTTTCYVYSLFFPKKFRYDYLRKVGIVLPSTKKDLASMRDVVFAAMKKHSFRRPPFGSIISGSY